MKFGTWQYLRRHGQNMLVIWWYWKVLLNDGCPICIESGKTSAKLRPDCWCDFRNTRLSGTWYCLPIHLTHWRLDKISILKMYDLIEDICYPMVDLSLPYVCGRVLLQGIESVLVTLMVLCLKNKKPSFEWMIALAWCLVPYGIIKAQWVKRRQYTQHVLIVDNSLRTYSTQKHHQANEPSYIFISH